MGKQQTNFAEGLEERLRSMASFLAIPLAVVAAFVALAGLTYWFDERLSKVLVSTSPALTYLEGLFGDRDSTRSLLGTIASALITVTSITFSLLLVAVQQAAASFSNQILEQFRNRKTNQFYFGFFVGLSLYALITLATMHNLHHPLFGALLSIILTVVALLLILVLIYTTIEQMRGNNVVDAIAKTVRSARDKERDLLENTRREPTPGLDDQFTHKSSGVGYVDAIDIAGLSKCLRECAPGAEVVLLATKGIYLGRGDPMAVIRSKEPIGGPERNAIEQAMDRSFDLVTASGLTNDPQYGVHQLATIAWNNTSTAVSNPFPPTIICRKLRELVWDWTEQRPNGDDDCPIVYPDLTMSNALAAIEAAAVASAESRQPQTLAEFYDAYSALLPRLDASHRAQVIEAVRLSLGALTNHFPTQRLNQAMERLADTLEEIGSGVGATVREMVRHEKRSLAFTLPES